eukprot:CFRG7174T1
MKQQTLSPLGLQALVLAGGTGSRMYPLTETLSKAMLTVGNRPMIWYALQNLESCGFEEILVLVRKEDRNLHQYLTEVYESKKAVVVISIEADISGTADALRSASGYIKSDVVVVSCDLVSNVNIADMVDNYRITDSDLSIALSQSMPHEIGPENKKAARGIKDYIGLDAESKRVVYYTPEADIDDELRLSRRMITKWPRVIIRNDLTDCHLYIMRKWVVDYIMADSSISSLKGDLIPLLIRRQYKRKQPSESMGGQPDLMTYIPNHGRLHSHKHDALICTYYEVKSQPCGRCNSVVRYSELNRLVSNSGLTKTSNRGENSHISKLTQLSIDSVVGSSCVVGDRVSIKNSTIGSHSKIGDNVKLNNCVVMDHVQICDGSILSNTVVCKQAYIQAGCHLKNCQVGVSYEVEAGVQAENESFVNTEGLLSI